jgi:hypothetical protein
MSGAGPGSCNIRILSYLLLTAEPKWHSEEIAIAFQIDGNYRQQPYSVWLDEVTLNAY